MQRRIKITKNGPYVVLGSILLEKWIIGINKEGDPDRWIPSKKYPSHKTYSLCSCGHSKKKPFCDGSHQKFSFIGKETANREPFFKQAKEITGPTLRLFDVLELCAVARFCDRADGTWKLTKKSDDPDSKKIAIEETQDCPSGRLVIQEKDSRKIIEPEFKPSIIVIEDPQMNVSGPLWVKGRIILESSDGFEYEQRNRYTLCRCGKSSNKPFCDGKHIQTKFKD